MSDRPCIVASYSHPFPTQRELLSEPCAFGTLLVCGSCGERHVRLDGCAGCAAQWKICDGYTVKQSWPENGKE